MLWVIVAIVIVGAVFGFGVLLGGSVARNVAGDRARRASRDRTQAPAPARSRRFVADVVMEG